MPKNEQQNQQNLTETQSTSSENSETSSTDSDNLQDNEIGLEQPTLAQKLKKKAVTITEFFFSQLLLNLPNNSSKEESKENSKKEIEQQSIKNSVKQEAEKKEQAEKAEQLKAKTQEKEQREKTAKEAEETRKKLAQRRFEEVHLRETVSKAVAQKESIEKQKKTLQSHIMEKGLLMTPIGSLIGIKKIADASKATFNQMNHAYYRKTNIQKGIKEAQNIKKESESANIDQLKDFGERLEHLKDLNADISDKLYRLDAQTRRYILERSKHMSDTNVPQGDIQHWIKDQCKRFERAPINKQEMQERLKTKSNDEPSLIRNKPKK